MVRDYRDRSDFHSEVRINIRVNLLAKGMSKLSFHVENGDTDGILPVYPVHLRTGRSDKSRDYLDTHVLFVGSLPSFPTPVSVVVLPSITLQSFLPHLGRWPPPPRFPSFNRVN